MGPHKGTSDGTVLSGMSASSGIAKGTAKIIIELEDVEKFKEGDILVAESTDPSLTPVIALSKAIVTELGGTLSHAAIISREYGIPAVVGVENVTKIIKDGDMIEVDGNKGKVKRIN